MSEGDPKTSSIVDAQKAHANLKGHSEAHTAKKKKRDCLLELLEFDLGSSVPLYTFDLQCRWERQRDLVHCCRPSLPHSSPSHLIRLLKLSPNNVFTCSLSPFSKLLSPLHLLLKISQAMKTQQRLFFFFFDFI